MRKLTTKDTEILLCYKKRRKADKRFFAIAKKYFTFTDVSRSATAEGHYS